MKASANQIAKRYVSALCAVAHDPALLQVLERDMQSLQQAYDASDALRQAIHNPLLPRDVQASMMAALGQKMKMDALTGQFLAMLSARRRLGLLPHIAALFAKEVADRRGEVRAELVSAGELSAKEIAAIAEQLGRFYGKKIVATTKQDQALLGGIVINVGSVQLDASLAGKLRRLGGKLKAA